MIFKPGTVVTFEPNNLNPEYWNSLSIDDKIKYYGKLGYGGPKKLFVFITEINHSGHCVLVDMDDGNIEVMVHCSDLRAATEEEF